jgi:hypothetical protein
MDDKALVSGQAGRPAPSSTLGTGTGSFDALHLALAALTGDGSHIRELTSFVRPDLVARFSLPPTLLDED